jgi:hypothetical protein
MINALKTTMMSERPDNADKIQNTKVHTICVEDGGPFRPIGNLIGEKENEQVSDINLFVVVGSDRADLVDSITDYYYKRPTVHSVATFILPREDVKSVGNPTKGMNEYKNASKTKDGLANLLKSEDLANIVKAQGMSASFVRNIVKFSDANTYPNDADAVLIKSKFFELYSPYLDNEKINKLYNSILTGITELGPNTTISKPSLPVRYDYPMSKPNSVFPVKKGSTRKGGRKGGRKGSKKSMKGCRKGSRKGSKKSRKGGRKGSRKSRRK